MITLFALSFLVILHELGHLLAAKIFGVKVLEFGLGIPPRALTVTKVGETELTLNYLPIGGFVRLYGEQGELGQLEELSPFSRKRAFNHKPTWQRAIILLSGIVVNILVGIILFSIIYTIVGIPRQTGIQVFISKVVDNSPAKLAGIKEGEIVARINDTEIENTDQFVRIASENKGKLINLYIKSLEPDGTTSTTSRVIPLIPRENPPLGQGALGIAVGDVPTITYDKKLWYLAPFYGAVLGVKESFAWAVAIGEGLIGLIGDVVQGRMPEGVGGPVQIIRAGNQAASAGIIVYLRFMAIISINLGIFNLLPIPALDGGRIFLLIVEKIVGKKKGAKIEVWTNAIGFFLLITLLVLITWMDLVRK